MNKALTLALICCLAFAAAVEVTQVEDETKYTIDQATDILTDLLADAAQNLEDLDNNWNVNKPILQETVDQIQTALTNKGVECAALDDVLANDRAALDEARKYEAWLRNRIQENTDRIAQILSERCTQNGYYIEGLKNDKIALKLVDFLRAQINAKESFDFAQRKAFMRNLRSFLAIYQRGDIEELLQLEKQVASDYEVDVDTSVEGRNDEEIGTLHVDNDQGDLELDGFENGQRKGWTQIRAELLEILDSLEETITAKIQRAQDDEVRSSVSAADFKLQLEHEIEVYLRELAKQVDKVQGLENDVAQDEENVADCRAAENTLGGQLDGAKKDLQDAEDRHTHKHNEIEDEISIFQEVLNLYLPSTANQSDSFKERTDDYLDNNTFDDGQYDDREVPDIDLINSF